MLERFIQSYKNLEQVIIRNGVDLLDRWYMERLLGYQKRRFFEETSSKEEFVGTIIGVSDLGRLRIKKETGEVKEFDLKEVKFNFSS